MAARFDPRTNSTSCSLTGLILLLLLVCLSDHCSPALSASTVTQLPGLHGPLRFHLETGYVGVDEENGSELFYYFIESERSPSTDPVLLWLTGGHRCSAFSGLAFEIGPVRFVVSPYNGTLPQLVYNHSSWTKVANIIFVDSPVGAGFSFSLLPQGYEVDDYISSYQLHKFLLKWFMDHQQFLSNPFYIGGDSYAGKLVPLIAQIVSEGIEAGQQPLLNLKGYLVGNPATGENIDKSSKVQYAHGVGIISDQIYESTVKNCEGNDSRNPSNEHCAKSLVTVNKLIAEIYEAYILDPLCTFASPEPKHTHASRQFLDDDYIRLRKPPICPSVNCISYSWYLSYYWANNNITRAALGIKKGTVSEWVRCNEDLPYARNLPSSIKYHRKLTTMGYRALVYSGDHDLVIPFLGTQAWVRSLNFSIVDDWRAWHLEGQAAGFTITYSNNMTFATIKGGGHTAPEYQPERCFAMVERWLANEPL